MSVRGRTSHANTDDDHLKSVRKYFIICTLLFTTNPTCATTMHHLVADTVEVNGGTRNLIRVLNRLGVSVASDTHDRLVTDVAESQRATPIWSELSPNTFTIASTDNIDFLQSHATVYCGDQTRSYHATTVQVVQPVPSLQLPITAPPGPPQPSTVEHLLGTTKRLLPHSPSNSPHQLGKVGPKRRRTIKVSPQKVSTLSKLTHTKSTALSHKNLKLDNFDEKADEKASKTKLYNEVFTYFLQKLVLQVSSKFLKPLREFLLPSPAQLMNSNSSLIYYMELIDENADSLETMGSVSELVLDKLLTESQRWVILVGDGKSYEHLQSMKKLYGSTFEKLLIFPGDWHILKNFQPVIMKAYYHAGLQQIAKESGYRAETLTSLEACSHFKRTHCFLLQVWEAMFTAMIRAFVTSYPKYADLEKAIGEEVEQATSSQDMLMKVLEIVNNAMAIEEFKNFTEKQEKADGTWHLWTNFVFKDCFSYVCLFLAIRNSNWDLRVASLKNMAPLFAAYDRPCYQKILPSHIADLECYPKEILDCFRAGGFTVKVKSGIGHAIALDEAHEMCVNRDLKMAIVRPTVAYVRKINHFFSYRVKAQSQLTSQLFPPTDSTHTDKSILWDSTASTKTWHENVMHMRSLIEQHQLFPHDQCNRCVMNVFTGMEATPEVSHDLLEARNIGVRQYHNYITHQVLQTPSTEATTRKKRLLTMAPTKVTKTRISMKEKEARDTNKYLRRRLEWCNRTGQKFDAGEEQYSLLPRAIADPEGNPHKGTKSKWTEKLKGQYKNPSSTPFMSALPWVPEVVIVDAMFPLNITPLRQHQTITDYANLIFNVSVLPHFRRGTGEVHLVFDHPERLDFNPKSCEHKRRYGKASSEHSHISVDPQSPIQRPWKQFLQCKQCKRSIVESIGWAFLRTAKSLLLAGQVLVLGGCFSGESQDNAWIITGGDVAPPQPSPNYSSNAQEADMRVWRHAIQSQHERVLICSADTDVYNIGLVISLPDKRVLVQLSPPQSNELYIDVQRLLLAFKHDTDLAPVPQHQLGSIMLQLYIVTGCDYTSFVSGIGKATFYSCLDSMRNLYQVESQQVASQRQMWIPVTMHSLD